MQYTFVYSLSRTINLKCLHKIVPTNLTTIILQIQKYLYNIWLDKMKHQSSVDVYILYGSYGLVHLKYIPEEMFNSLSSEGDFYGQVNHSVS